MHSPREIAVALAVAVAVVAAVVEIGAGTLASAPGTKEVRMQPVAQPFAVSRGFSGFLGVSRGFSLLALLMFTRY